MLNQGYNCITVLGDWALVPEAERAEFRKVNSKKKPFKCSCSKMASDSGKEVAVIGGPRIHTYILWKKIELKII